jgi:hypothetical protein
MCINRDGATLLPKSGRQVVWDWRTRSVNSTAFLGLGFAAIGVVPTVFENAIDQ